MPNNYTTVLICLPGEKEFDVDAFLKQYGEKNLCEIVRPSPDGLDGINYGHSNGLTHWRDDGSPVDVAQLTEEFGAASRYEWCSKYWGTKWGTYRTKALQLGGDCQPVVISFESAWGPPSIMDEIEQWLKDTFGFIEIKIIGVDPYDASIQLVNENIERP